MFALKVQCDLPEDAIDAAPMPHSIRVLDLNERVITHEAFLYAGHQQPQALLILALCSAEDHLPQAFLYAGNQQPQAHHLSTLILFFKHESDWPCLSPLVGSCLRRDTPEAAAILGKSLSAIASTEELVLTASSVLLVLPASSGYVSPPNILPRIRHEQSV